MLPSLRSSSSTRDQSHVRKQGSDSVQLLFCPLNAGVGCCAPSPPSRSLCNLAGHPLARSSHHHHHLDARRVSRLVVARELTLFRCPQAESPGHEKLKFETQFKTHRQSRQSPRRIFSRITPTSTAPTPEDLSQRRPCYWRPKHACEFSRVLRVKLRQDERMLPNAGDYWDSKWICVFRVGPASVSHRCFA